MVSSQSLKSKAIKGGIWSGIERVLAQAITFVLSLFIARLVTPDDYGVLAILMVFVSFAGVLVDSGFANALVRKIDSNDIDRSTVFYFNIVVALLIYILLFCSAPYIASMYNQPSLRTLLRVSSIVVIINSLAVIQQAILVANIDFKTQTKVSLISSGISGFVGIILAYLDYGVWALVAQLMLQALLRSILLWYYVAWKPLMVFSKSSFQNLFGYSYKLLLSGMLITCSSEIFQLLIGKFYSTASLGYYNYANRMANFPSTNLTIVVQRVAFPVLSQMQNNDDALISNFRKFNILLTSINLPLMLAISILAEPIVHLLLTDVWYDVIPILTVMALTMTVYPILVLNINILWIKGRSDLTLILEILSIAIKFTILFFVYDQGLLRVCILLGIGLMISSIIYACFVGKVCKYGLLKQLKDLLPVILKSAVSAFIVYLLVPYIENGVLKIICGVLMLFFINVILIVSIRGTEYDIIKEVIENIKLK